ELRVAEGRVETFVDRIALPASVGPLFFQRVTNDASQTRIVSWTPPGHCKGVHCLESDEVRSGARSIELVREPAFSGLPRVELFDEFFGFGPVAVAVDGGERGDFPDQIDDVGRIPRDDHLADLLAPFRPLRIIREIASHQGVGLPTLQPDLESAHDRRAAVRSV